MILRRDATLALAAIACIALPARVLPATAGGATWVLPAAAGSATWAVEGKLFGEPKKDRAKPGRVDKDDVKKSTDVSGLACATTAGFPRTCLIADDQAQGVQIVILEDGRLLAGDFIRLTDETHGDRALDLDAEAVAYADGLFYVVGSHGRPRHTDGGPDDPSSNARAAASRKLFRLRIDPAAVDARGRLTGPVAVTASTALPGLLAAERALLFDQPLKKDGLNIEGAAVKGGRLYAGFRGPLVGGRAAILSVPLGVLFEGEIGKAEVTTVDLGGARGVRDLVTFGDAFLVLAGPVQDPADGSVADGDYAVTWWDGAGRTKSLGAVPSLGPKVKPEALLPLGEADGRLRLLVLFDGPDEGGPRVVEVDAP